MLYCSCGDNLEMSDLLMLIIVIVFIDLNFFLNYDPPGRCSVSGHSCAYFVMPKSNGNT